MSGEFEPVRVVFRGYRTETAFSRTIRRSEHDGAFPSVNDIGAPGNTNRNHGYENAKLLYSRILRALLQELTGREYEFIKPGTKTTRVTLPVEREGELPHPMGFVLAEGRCVFPTRQTRDQMNYGTIIWKFLGDVLQDAGYLEHDDWTRYQCGNLERGWDTSRPAWTELVFFPAAERRVLVDEAQREGAMF